MKIHGHEKRRGWIKVHLAVDPKTQELIAIEVTDDKVADGAYDRSSSRKHLYDKGL